MNLDERQIIRANLFHVFLKKQSNVYFKEHKITKCEKCKQTGLGSLTLCADKTYAWDASSFCSECNGIGYLGIANGGFTIDLLNFICRKCDGIGCKECEYDGIVDWVAHMMGR